MSEDPRIKVLLVASKGAAAFDELESLPHVSAAVSQLSSDPERFSALICRVIAARRRPPAANQNPYQPIR
jgi:DNA segregation ATPase FtsK/SpoIIIE-like protein